MEHDRSERPSRRTAPPTEATGAASASRLHAHGAARQCHRVTPGRVLSPSASARAPRAGDHVPDCRTALTRRSPGSCPPSSRDAAVSTRPSAGSSSSYHPLHESLAVSSCAAPPLRPERSGRNRPKLSEFRTRSGARGIPQSTWADVAACGGLTGTNTVVTGFYGPRFEGRSAARMAGAESLHG